MKAIWNNTVIAEADKQDLIYIEGNWYFPPSAVAREYFKPSDQHTTCFWKGEASYYDIEAGGSSNAGAAWFYPHPLDGAITKVKKDFTNYVAFWQGVEVKE
jgi:uncharacterized protein (DUF427 family)